jgi:hypothetical protein
MTTPAFRTLRRELGGTADTGVDSSGSSLRE